MTMLDVLCFNDLDIFATEITDPLEQLGQDNYHRLIEAPGSNPDDLNRGFGIEERLSGVLDPAIGPGIEAELRKDTRNATVTAQVTSTGPGQQRIEIAIETDDDELLEMVLEADRGRVTRIS
jgi:hypothetical protein